METKGFLRGKKYKNSLTQSNIISIYNDIIHPEHASVKL